MKKNAIAASSLFLALLLFLVPACSSSSSGKNTSESQYSSDSAGYGGSAAEYDYYSEEYAADEIATTPTADLGPTYGLKIIRTSYLNIETTSFQKSYDALMAALKEAGGYISSSSRSGGNQADGSYLAQYIDLELKIPIDKYDSFLGQSGSFGNVTSQRDTTEDITTAYLDTEARIASLKTQEARMLELEEQASNLDELLRIESELTSVRSQLESVTRQLQTYDNRTNFATVHISLSEVSLYTPSTKAGFFSRFVQACKQSFVGFSNFLQDFVLFLVYIFPYAVIGTLLFFILRPAVRRVRARKGKRARKAKEGSENSENTADETESPPSDPQQ